MRAVTIRGYGGLDRVQVETVPRPVPRGPHDVVVALRAAALNHLDLYVIGGLPGTHHDFPHVLGADGAGVVEAVGTAVTRVRPGDQVMLNPGSWCGECRFCLNGEQGMCERYQLLGEHRNGTYAEAVLVSEPACEKLGGEVRWPEAAAFPLVSLTAWRMLTTRARLQPAETVLIWGIGGGVALASLGIAKVIGARAIVTSSSDEKLARAKQVGADFTINHRTQDVAKEVRRLTDKRGADVVVDTVGKETWEASLRAAARLGRVVTCGGTSGHELMTDVRRLFWHQYTIMGSTMGNRREFEAIAALFSRGQLKPVVDSVVPLDETREALERMQAGAQFGKIVIEIG